MTDYNLLANSLRILSIDMVAQAESGHPGMPLGFADVITVLYKDFLRHDPQSPRHPERDRFVLSNGHGSALLYSVLYMTGYEDVSMEDLKNFRQLGSKTAGHPEFGHLSAIETTTGPLGQGIATAVGMAIAAKQASNESKIYTSIGDGCLMEGISHEACELAGHLKLDNLILLFDDNSITIDGKTSVSTSTNTKQRFESYGFEVISCDGHNHAEIHNAIAIANESNQPSLVMCKTHIGYGCPDKMDTSGVHGTPLTADEIAIVRKELNWKSPAFEMPQEVYDAWQTLIAKLPHLNDNNKNISVIPAEAGIQFKEPQACFSTPYSLTNREITSLLSDFKQNAINSKPNIATRKANGQILEILAQTLPNLISGSADLSGSVQTLTASMKAITAEDYNGNFIHYGVREHAMAAIANGLALYNSDDKNQASLLPIVGTYLAFADYLKPALRLSALMGLRVVYVLTHDSIGVGKDGSTHQPIEQLAMLRATPNVNVFRPADSVEVAEAWEIILSEEQANTPSVMVLSRQGLPTVRAKDTKKSLASRGAYILSPAPASNSNNANAKTPQGILLASGSEVQIALQAQKLLADKHDIAVSVVSVPCMEIFSKQSEEYQQSVLPAEITARVAIEAGHRQSWDKYLGLQGGFIGMDSFGASASGEELYKHFGITAEAVVELMKEMLV